MVENGDDLARIAESLREPVRIDPALDARVMAEIEALPRQPSRLDSRGHWLFRRRTFRLSPMGVLAMAAGLAALVLVAGRVGANRAEPPGAATGPPVEDQAAAGGPGQTTQFVFVAPDARSVSIVGDFNDWSFSATPLEQQPGDGLWWVTLSLPPGRYRYAFVVDGTRWRKDPNSPAAEDEFGRPNSVVTIGGP